MRSDDFLKKPLVPPDVPYVDKLPQAKTWSSGLGRALVLLLRLCL